MCKILYRSFYGSLKILLRFLKNKRRPTRITKDLTGIFRNDIFKILKRSLYRDPLRRLERVFRCCSVCETMEDNKEGYLMVWTNYMSPCSPIVGLYFKGDCDVISVTMAMHKVHNSVL